MDKIMVTVKDFEEYALKTLPKHAYEYYSSGANEEFTSKDNVEAFKRWKIRPRVLRNVFMRDMRTTVLGHEIDFPVCISPTACHGFAHDEAEIGTAKGAQSMKVIYTMSSASNTGMEDISKCVPNGLHFYQIYIFNIPNGRQVAVQHMHKAERLGFKAIVYSADLPVVGNRYNEKKNGFKLPKHLKLAEFEDHDGEMITKGHGSELIVKSHGGELMHSGANAHNTWDDLKWLKSQTSLPFIIKGIMTAEDALLAVECGVDAIFVSNHGGRQLDTVPATLDVLPEIIAAVAGRCEVYLDGGVRHGTDVFKALALGAKAVFVGRPAVYGLAYKGAEGVNKVLTILRDELSTAMALAGCACLNDIKRDMVMHAHQYPAKL